MFGIGFTEILLISIIAILFLGPDKLPETMVQIAKFIKSVKKTVGEAKGALEEELKIADLKEEALSYKQQLDSATSELRSFKNIDIDDIINDEPEEAKSTAKATPVTKAKDPKDPVETVEVEQKNETVTFKKKSSKKKEVEEESSTESTQVFKTDIDEKEGNA